MSTLSQRLLFKTAVFNEGMVLPGAYNGLTAKQIQQAGFKGVYISGAGLSASTGLPDIELLSLTEWITFIRYIVSSVDIGCICDADTGFGSLCVIRRMIESFESIGLCGCHIEDQVSPKRCGHLDQKQLIDTDLMCEKIRAACLARKDPDFLIIARCDAYDIEGLNGLLDRCRAYIEAGADMIFPEALDHRNTFSQVASALSVPLVANMTEFGKSDLIPSPDLIDMGYRLVLYPVSALRIQAYASEKFFHDLFLSGCQQKFLKSMQTRDELYSLLKYEDYVQFDQNLLFKGGANDNT